MMRTPRQRAARGVSLLLAAAPIGFALMAAFSGRRDLRMLWMAVASFIGASAVVLIGRRRRPAPRAIVAQAAGALVVAMLLAGWTAYRLGATAAAGIWPVAFVLSFCWAASYALHALATPRPTSPLPETR